MAIAQDTPPMPVADHAAPVLPCAGRCSVEELNRVIARQLSACESRALDSAADQVAVTMVLSQAIGRWLEKLGLEVK